MMTRCTRFRVLCFGGLLALMLLAAGCAATRDTKGRPLTTLNPRGVQAQKIDDLVTPVFAVAGVVFILINGAILFLIFRFRRRRDDVDGVNEPVQMHGNPRLEWAWTILPAIVLASLAVGNVKTLWSLEDRDADPLKVEVTGQQWWWEFRYDVDNDGKADIITPNQMVIPVGRQVAVSIRSNDVIHSFWIPALNGKKDAVPGRTHPWSLEADQPGIYEGQCTEFCGLSHGYMRMQVRALSVDDYNAWVAEQTKPAVDPAVSNIDATAGRATFKAQCAQCHQVNGFDETGKATDGTPNNDYRGDKHPLTSRNAPNLTHLMSRQRFAGNMFDLHLDGKTDGAVNESEVGAWLRNPSLKKPMAADQNRGMPNLGLTEEQIHNLVAYLSTLK